MNITVIIVELVIMFLFAWMLHIAGAQTFAQGVILAYVYAFAVFAVLGVLSSLIMIWIW